MSRTSMAHIERVTKIYPIEGADKIEMCQLLDFHIVVKKNEFKVNDLVVYIEVDSILPDGLPEELKVELDIQKKLLKKATGDDIKIIEEKIQQIVSQNTIPEFEFLRQKKFRIKALKYNFDNGFGGKIISQGIVFSTSILPKDIEISEGMDVTQILKIEKVVEDIEELNSENDSDDRNSIEKFLDNRFMKYKFYRKLKKQIKGEKLKGSWDNWLPKESDETNAQNIYTKFINTNGRTGYYVTLKMEGQNYSIYNRYSKTFFGLMNKLNFGVCSDHKNLITDDGSHFWDAAKRLDLQKKISKINSEIVVRGELMGPKICENIYGFPNYRFFVFEVYNPKTKKYYNFQETIDFCNKYGFEFVPIIDFEYTLPETVHELLEYSNRKDELVPGKLIQSEGIIIRKKDDMTKSMKAKSPIYLAGKKWF